MPAQSGSNSVLEAMRRGYTKEAYLNLIEHVREIIPGFSINFFLFFPQIVKFFYFFRRQFDERFYCRILWRKIGRSPSDN